MRLTLAQVRKTAVILSIVILSGLGGYRLGLKGTPLPFIDQGQVHIDRTLPENRKDIEFDLFWKTWEILESSYFDKSKLNAREMVYGAIKGMVSAVGDPYTVFLPPAEQKRSEEDLGGAFEGVGIQIGFKGSQLAVIAPLEGSPAEKAGVRAGDFIVGIKDAKKGIDRGTIGITLPEAVEAIRGPAGSQVVLVLTREGKDEPFEVEITRAQIEVPSVRVEFVGEGGNIAHLKLLRFGEQTKSEWDQAIMEIIRSNAKGVILDVRNNPGGFLSGSVSISSEFLTRGVVVIQEDGRGRREVLSVTGRPRLPATPLVVLVNKGSASASEIVAGALKDHKRARIIGEATFGKGTIQEAQELDSSGLHITVARWLTPDGNWINEQGLKPDVEIIDDPETEEDEQLQKAVELLR